MFKNPEFDIDQFLAGGNYIIGPSPLAAYTLDDVRVQISSLAPSKVSVSRKSPGLFGSKFCCEVVTVTPKSTMANQDSDNLEFPIEADDIRGACWGTPYAAPLTISLDFQTARAGDYAACMADWNHNVHCLNKFTIPSDGAALSRASVTFPPAFSGNWSEGAKFILNLGTGPQWSGDPATMASWQPSAGWTFAGAQNLTMQPAGSFLRIGRVQADIGLQAQPFRYIPDFLRLMSCQRVLFKTFPQGEPVRWNGGSFEGAASYTARTASITTGGDVRVKYPVPMLSTPLTYFYNPRAENRLWRAYNGTGADSAPVQKFFENNESVLLFNAQLAGDPPGELLAVHMVASCQRGGNGWL